MEMIKEIRINIIVGMSKVLTEDSSKSEERYKFELIPA
jgi:hypothetical protein